MYELLPDVIGRMRKGQGPALVEAQVVRLDPHSSSDDQRKYRPEEELKDIIRYDPLVQTEQYLLYHDVLKPDDVNALRAEIKAEVDLAAAEADRQPEPNPATVMENIYAPDPVLLGKPADPSYLPGSEVAMIDAINHGLREEMERNPKILMWGEDIADPKGGVFGVTRGLSSAFPNRVFNSPLAEASIAGIAAGMAIAGYKPIIEIQFADYLWPAALELRDEIPTVRWRSQGEW
jgi:2-oxoisovalerate dehydrogenase E1 component